MEKALIPAVEAFFPPLSVCERFPPQPEVALLPLSSSFLPPVSGPLPPGWLVLQLSDGPVPLCSFCKEETYKFIEMPKPLWEFIPVIVNFMCVLTLA